MKLKRRAKTKNTFNAKKKSPRCPQELEQKNPGKRKEALQGIKAKKWDERETAQKPTNTVKRKKGQEQFPQN